MLAVRPTIGQRITDKRCWMLVRDSDRDRQVYLPALSGAEVLVEQVPLRVLRLSLSL